MFNNEMFFGSPIFGYDNAIFSLIQSSVRIILDCGRYFSNINFKHNGPSNLIACSIVYERDGLSSYLSARVRSATSV